jgi:serine/threonine protein kinase
MAQYIPVGTSMRKDCEALHREAKRDATDDCGYVLKVITYDHKKFRQSGGKSLERYYREWYNEYSVFRRLNELQEESGLVFSPKLYDRWYCAEGAKGKVYFYLLMEKYDGDLFHLLPDSSNEYRNIAMLMTLDRMDLYLDMIHRELKICLNDINLRNILYKITEDEIQVVFSDFGIASQDADEECIRLDRENFHALKREFRLNRQ